MLGDAATAALRSVRSVHRGLRWRWWRRALVGLVTAGVGVLGFRFLRAQLGDVLPWVVTAVSAAASVVVTAVT